MPNYPMYPQNYPTYPTYQYQPYPAYQQPVQNVTPPQQPVQQPAPPVNTSLVPVRSFAEIDQWPIAPNSCVTFVVEGNPPTVCTKSRGLSQLEPPALEVFDLVKRDSTHQPVDAPQSAVNAPAAPMPDYALRSDLDALRGEIVGELEGFRARLDELPAEKPAARGKKKEDDGDG